MSDFTSDFWSYYVAVITLASIAACAVLLWSMSTRRVAGDKVETMGHVWDENLVEYNNPLPNWWRWMFYITIVFGAAYLLLYPGLGRFAGYFGWTSSGQYQGEQAKAEADYGPLFAKYAAMDIPAVAADPQAREIGQRLFLNYCSQCHASDARGGRGFPNLTDKDWLYGGDPATIEATITSGRNGIMPPLGQALGEEGVKNVAQYVLSLSGGTHDAAMAAKGKETFGTICVACHGPDGKGNPALGAPNLTDQTWLYGGAEATIAETVRLGRNNKMPAWGEFLGPAKVHLLAAYVWGLSNGKP
ncbi:MAG TPA: cytochrome-c oxidase, cbb3-type subunit III [Burkholderiales bacterium]|nr:cytochrome-c oxidase, cbb3-type subunit III [Burkholderiales bacterium]